MKLYDLTRLHEVLARWIDHPHTAPVPPWVIAASSTVDAEERKQLIIALEGILYDLDQARGQK